MKAYKGFESDLSCKGFQYEIGGTYEEPGAVLCECGFHACTNPLDVFKYYHPIINNRFCEVDICEVSCVDRYGIHASDSKIAAKKIQIVREMNVFELIDEFRKMTPGNGVPIQTDCGAFSVSMSDPDVKSLSFVHDIKDTVFAPNCKLISALLRVGSFNDETFINMMGSNSESHRIFGVSHISPLSIVAVLKGNKSRIITDAHDSSIISIGDHTKIESKSTVSAIVTSGRDTEVIIYPSQLSYICHVYCGGSDSKIRLYEDHIYYAYIGGIIGTTIEILSRDGKVAHRFMIYGDKLKPNTLYQIKGIDDDGVLFSDSDGDYFVKG